jgi:uncharacterized protein
MGDRSQIGQRVTVTGATGLIGPPLVAALREHGAQVTILTRDPQRAERALGDVEAVRWEPMQEPAPTQALAGADAVVHLAGAPVAQRWSAKAKRAIRDSRTVGTANLLEGLARTGEAAGAGVATGAGGSGGRPRTLVSSSAIGYYGAHAEEPLDEDASPGLGMRAVQVRTGVVLDRDGGALAKMLPPFRLGVGGPVAGGRQYISWIHTADLVGIMLAALSDQRWSGPANATAPQPVPNREFSKALGHVLGRPSLLPVPGLALRALYGEMAEIVTTGARVMPAKALVLGYEFQHPQLEPALRAALNDG